jgi:GxxExxY protein
MPEPDSELDALAKAVVDAAFAVHKTLGPGDLESVYEEALCVELEHRRIAFESQVAFHVEYRGEPAGEGRMDLLVGGRLVVELKAEESLGPIHKAQVISHLKASGHTPGLLINFNVPLIKNGIQRIVLS